MTLQFKETFTQLLYFIIVPLSNYVKSYLSINTGIFRRTIIQVVSRQNVMRNDVRSRNTEGTKITVVRNVKVDETAKKDSEKSGKSHIVSLILMYNLEEVYLKIKFTAPPNEHW